ncbi:long-chain fatty alcohol dehydrogenase [Wilcoxina mikolae CBS 423.85]|nr:long-chain fatty alcohol dehydrogenase [Wilcoxina mikolae CBS 423.85]
MSSSPSSESITFLSSTFPLPFPPQQWETLLSLSTTFIPALSPAEISTIKSTTRLLPSQSWGNITPFLSTSATDNPDFSHYLAYYITHHLSPAATSKILSLLTILSSGGIKSYLLTSTTTPFPLLPREHREQILLSWKSAYLPIFRRIFTIFRGLTAIAFLRTSKELCAAINYAPVDPRKLGKEELAARGLPKYTFEAISGEKAEIEVDVVVVGSGSGGQVVAAKLAQAGVRVLVVDKGVFYGQEELPMTEMEGSERLYECGAGLPASNGGGVLMAAKTWGGGATVNWAVCLQLHRSVRKEWSEKAGLRFVETVEFQKCLDRVCERMGVSTENVRHNFANQVLVDGARNLGYKSTVLPRNTGGREHSCGYCGFGCGSGEKRGGVITWLDDAQKAGAKFVQDCEVKKVVIENGVAKGIVAVVGGKTELMVKAQKVGPALTPRSGLLKKLQVIISAGPLNSPCILSASGLKNPNIGQNLKIHPVGAVRGLFHNTDCTPSLGGPMTAIVTDNDNLDSSGYGAKLYASAMHPAQGLGGAPWDSAVSFRSRILLYPQTVFLLSIIRDRDSSGTVFWDPITHSPQFSYNYADFDKNTSMLSGLLTAAEIMVSAGADEVSVTGWPVYTVDKTTPEDGGGVADARFRKWVQECKRVGVVAPYSAAHPSGTCRMGMEERASVVDKDGKVWGVKGLYVADASVLPTSSGVNPMVTTMALAEWIAGGILEGR